MFKKLFSVKKKQIKQKKRFISDLKKIESVLHPCPKICNVEILHRHQGQKIIFTAWIGKNPFNKFRTVEVSRLDVLHDKEFYKTYRDEFAWLCEGSAEATAI
jgi:hypothetical protein